MHRLKPLSRYLDGSYYLYDAEVVGTNYACLFELTASDYPRSATEAIRGRGEIAKIKIGTEWAMRRHYRRGGCFAAVADDRYFWTGLERSRPVREWRLLAQLYCDGFPVPRPIAMRLVRSGLWYRADLITLEIGNARTLAETLESEPLTADAWGALGETLARFHGAGVYHSDLNANNILLDKQKRFYLIDFDKSSFRFSDFGWKRRNIERLRHSLNKLSHSNKIRHWRLADFDYLLKSYYFKESRPNVD